MKLHRVRQMLVSAPLADLRAEVFRQLDRLGPPPQGEVALTAGSRGIDGIPVILRAAGDWLKAHGARPFVVPAMGSHNGATAEGQRAMVESLGMTEEVLDMEIRSSMECARIGGTTSGDVWMDAHCHKAAGVLVINRVKLHTGFSGPVQSGLTKMMVVGMGKIRSAQSFHSTPTAKMKDMLLEMGAMILDSGKIWGGLALLEDGFDRMAEIHAIPAAEILQREPALLERHWHYFPTLPVDHLNVLVVDEIGKIYSGTGMDTNVLGFRGVKFSEDLTKPVIQQICALSLSPRSQGNAIGIGLADFCTRRLRDAIDEAKTFTNVFTTGEMQRMKIPATFADDEELVTRVAERFGGQRWMLIPNTLHLGTLFVSPDLVPELKQHPRCQVDDTPVELTFRNGRQQLVFE